jgi:coenzyme F420 hydrogenase subunit beta
MAEESIGGAATVVMESGAPPRPKVRIARNRPELISAQGSKYCPAPILTLLQDLKKEERPIAFAGLGCHVHGIRNMLGKFPELTERMGPIIGLICDRVMASSAIDYLVWRSGIKDHEGSILEYRNKKWRGYPGDVRIMCKSDREVFLPGKERRKVKDYFTPARCRLCFDKMNVLSDVTVGDPWGVAQYDKTHGESVIVARTPVGIQTVKKAVDAGFLALREIPYSTVLQGQGINIKKKVFASYCRAWTSMDMPLPAQSEVAFDARLVTTEDRKFTDHLKHSLELDQFPSKKDIFTDVKRWQRRQRSAKTIRKIFRLLPKSPFFLRKNG